MKQLLVFLLMFITVSGSAQIFLHDDNYVYAKGIGKTQEDADFQALQALAKTIRVDVKSEIRHQIHAVNKDVTEVFDNNSSAISNMLLKDTKVYVEHDRHNKVVVYRYINKTQYINEHTKEFVHYRNYADSLINNVGNYNIYTQHRINLILGALYKAYAAIDTDLMDAFVDGNFDVKDGIIKEANKAYICYDEYSALYHSKNNSITTMISAKYHNLPGFQYYKNGEWLSPERYSVDKTNTKGYDYPSPANKDIKYCYISIPFSEYPVVRINYEVISNNHYVIIKVPDEWYFKNFKIVI